MKIIISLIVHFCLGKYNLSSDSFFFFFLYNRPCTLFYILYLEVF